MKTFYIIMMGHIFAVLWNRNDLLRFRFRRSFGWFRFRPRFQFRFRIQTIFNPVFQKRKKFHKILSFMSEDAYCISQKVGLSFLILLNFLKYILCWIQIQIKFRNPIRSRNRNAFRFQFRQDKKIRFLRFRFWLH